MAYFPGGVKGDIADSPLNTLAGEGLKRARVLLGKPRKPMSQAAFMAHLKQEMGFAKEDSPFSQSAFSDWEGGVHTVPAAILIAAARVVSKRLEPTLVEELIEGREVVQTRLREVVAALLDERPARPATGRGRGEQRTPGRSERSKK